MSLGGWYTLAFFGPAAAASKPDDATATITADIQGTAKATGSIEGAGTVPLAKATRLRNAPATITGLGQVVQALPKGRARPTATISIGSRPSATDVAEAVVAQKVHGLGPGTVTLGEVLGLVTRILRNRTVTDPTTGTLTVFGDDDTTPLLSADLWDDKDATAPYSGAGADRRDRLE